MLKLLCCVLLLLLLVACTKPRQAADALPNPYLIERAGVDTEPANVTLHRPVDRRLLFAQIVEDEKPDQFDESGIIEGAPYKYFLRSLVGVSHDELRERTNEQLTFENLMQRPGYYRGHVHTLSRGVCLEVSRAEPTPDYGLPPGYTILPAVFVDAARDIYALRILCPPGSKLYDKLREGIDNDALPVARVTGYFMKLYARATNDANEPPWRRPLLICPELELSQAVQPRKVADEMRESKTDRLLPSHRLNVPGAEERLVLEARRGPSGKAAFKAAGQDLRGDLTSAVGVAVRAFCRRLPPEQADHPAAVILLTSDAPPDAFDQALSALRAAGVTRLAVKREEVRKVKTEK